jgi:hypothetical protein
VSVIIQFMMPVELMIGVDAPAIMMAATSCQLPETAVTVTLLQVLGERRQLQKFRTTQTAALARDLPSASHGGYYSSRY